MLSKKRVKDTVAMTKKEKELNQCEVNHFPTGRTNVVCLRSYAPAHAAMLVYYTPSPSIMTVA